MHVPCQFRKPSTAACHGKFHQYMPVYLFRIALHWCERTEGGRIWQQGLTRGPSENTECHRLFPSGLVLLSGTVTRSALRFTGETWLLPSLQSAPEASREPGPSVYFAALNSPPNSCACKGKVSCCLKVESVYAFCMMRESLRHTGRLESI